VATSDRLGLDTSVVVRLVTGLPPHAAARAQAFLCDRYESGQQVLVSDLVVAEAYFAMHTHYGIPKRAAIDTLLEFLRNPAIASEPEGCAADALAAAVAGPASPGFVDRLLHAQYARHGAGTASFETAFRKLPGAVVLKP